jgi:hypothetical protein
MNMDVYRELVDREKNLILAIMMKVTHIELRERLKGLKIGFEFAEPFDEDVQGKWASVGRAYTDGIISLDTAVRMVSLANPEEEIARIEAEKAKGMEDTLFPLAGE